MARPIAEKPRRFEARAPRSGLSRAWLALLPVLTMGAVDCYSTGDGTPPPLKDFYFPVGLQVSAGGTVLYAINSDFDLQYNGGTLQSYDLGLIRRHTLDLIADPRNPNVPVLGREQLSATGCPGPPDRPATLGETCAPPVQSSFYVRDAVIIGAFATNLLLSRPPSQLDPQTARPAGEPPPGKPAPGTRGFDRLFSPVRGNASLTWASVQRDAFDSVAPADPAARSSPFFIDCGRDAAGRCDAAHTAGENSDEPGNPRHVTMPGEPFDMAMSEDGESLVVTHQNETKTSLFSTGLTRGENTTDPLANKPALQFVLDGMPLGGVGVAAVPHDRDAFPPGTTFPSPAFLETSRSVAEVSLLRWYKDEGLKGEGPTATPRPFLTREAAVPILVGPSSSDSRGIAIDPTPRILCKSKVAKESPATGRTAAMVAAETLACARKPARVFIANRAPAALLVGEIGGSVSGEDTYDPDRLVIHTSIPLSAGPTKIYLAPVVERDGAYALRVFAVCFDSATVFVYDPDTEQVENIIRVGLGPFAMAFDPFDINDVATHAQVPFDAREAGRGLRRYRFAYLASFTNSFVQVLDLDNAQANRSTFEKIVFTLGRPQTPKGS